MSTKISIASDHAGFELKQLIVQKLMKDGYTVDDLGPANTDSVDYPDFAFKVANAVSKDETQFGILVCGSGLGMAIAANKVKGVRAVTCSESLSARLSREHNDANVLCLGARIIGVGMAFEIVSVWLSANFLGDRHKKRLNKITSFEGC